MTDDFDIGHEWLGATVEHEGCPLALRIRVGVGTPSHRARWSHLAAVTHVLANVRPNGLPDASYNDGLADFDAEVVNELEREGHAVVALIEMFAGERTYYAYADAAGWARAAAEHLRKLYPQHELVASGSSDPEWKCLAEYRSRWPW